MQKKLCKSKKLAFVLGAITLATLSAPANALQFTWEGDTPNMSSQTLMSEVGNWTEGLPPLSGATGDELVFPAIGGLTTSTIPSVDGIYVYPKISVNGTYSFINAGGSFQLNSNTTTNGLFHAGTGAVTFDVPISSTGGVYVHSNGGGMIFQKPLTIGSATSHFLQLEGTGNVSIQDTLTGTGTMNVGFATSTPPIPFSGQLHLGNLGTGFTGQILVAANSPTTIFVEHSNGLGANGGGVRIESTVAQVVFAPTTGGLTIKEAFNFFGRPLASTTPVILNSNGNNLIDAGSVIALGGGSMNIIKTVAGSSLELRNNNIGTSANSGGAGANGYNFRFDTEANSMISIVDNGAFSSNIGLVQNTTKNTNIFKSGPGTLSNNARFNNYTGLTTIEGGHYIFSGKHLTAYDYIVGATGSTDAKLTVNGTGDTITSKWGMYIGNDGVGELVLNSGNININTDGIATAPRTVDFFGIGRNAGAVGTFTQNGGSIKVTNDWFVLGVAATAKGTGSQLGGTIDTAVFAVGQDSTNDNTFTQNGAAATIIAGDILLGANPSSVGTLTQKLGSITATNLVAGRGGTGTFKVEGGTSNFNTIVVGNDATAIGSVNQSGGTVTTTNGIGLGITAGASGNYTLSGGTLDVTGGTGKIVAGAGTSTFNFTGGTLKVLDFNDTSVLPGGTNIGATGNLVQNGVGSLLDITSNDTRIRASYNLGAGTATVGNTRTLTIDGGMIDSVGTGTVNVNTGGSIVTNNLRTDNVALNGTAIVRADGTAAGASKVETLTIGAGGKLNLKDNDLVVGSALNFNAVRTAIIAGKTPNAATGITSDVTGFGISRGFGYAMGNSTSISSLLNGSLSGQAYDTDSVLVKFTLLGDADLDGDTDLNDLGLWSNGYTGDLGVTTSPTTFWTSGDFDYDGDTDLNDLGLWSSTYTGDFNGGPGSLVLNAPNASPEAVAILNSMGFTVVPEPSTFVLAGVGLTGLAIAARRRKKHS